MKLVSFYAPSLIDLHRQVNELGYCNLLFQVVPDTSTRGYWAMFRMSEMQIARWIEHFPNPRPSVIS